MNRLFMVCVAAAMAASVPGTLFAAEDSAAGEAAAIGDWGVDTGGFSTTVRPGDDFYRYVNERWLKTAKIPEGLAATDALTELYLVTEARVGTLITATSEAKHAPGTPEQQIADMYRSQSNAKRRNELGLTPIASNLSMVGGASTPSEIARVMALPWMDSPFASGVTADVDHPGRQIVGVVQSGLTLPARDYYLEPGEPYATLRVSLQDYVAATFRRAGIADADARAARVVALETEIARRQWSTTQARDVVKMNHPMSPDELKAWAPGFDWDAFLLEKKFENVPVMKVMTDTAIRDLARLVADTPASEWQSYFLFHGIDGWADSLSDDWQEAHFDFHARKLQGIQKRRSADLESIASVNGALGEEIGRIYVKKYFPEAHRAEINRMVGYIRMAFHERINKLEWMDAATRAEALAKLEKVVSHIGYPDRWHDRSGVLIAADDYVGNQARLMQWQVADSLQSLTEPSRNWEFPYHPQEINAGYMGALNSITFPAGILQPPFFDPNADPAVNFGAIAAVIGHEFGHGFDDQGSRLDGDGRLRDWWTPGSRKQFEMRTAGLVSQFSAYEPVPGTRINGAQNLGENIGDLGGLSIAYEAYRKYVKDTQGGKEILLDGYSGNQRFFLSWAQIWRSLITPDEERRRILSDNHSPGEFRTNGVVRNMDAWYDAFAVKPGDALYLPPDQRVRIW